MVTAVDTVKLCSNSKKKKNREHICIHNVNYIIERILFYIEIYLISVVRLQQR